jgi:hypothetical protein
VDQVLFLREQLQSAHGLLEDTVGDSTSEHLHYIPQGHALPVGAAYAHVLFSEDMLVQGMLRSSAPRFSTLNGRSGVSEPMPDFSPAAWAGYEGWTRRVKVDLPALRAYGKQVYADTDAYLAGLSEADLAKSVDLSDLGFGNQTLAWFIGRILIGHVDNLTGEISAAKGLQGLKGYPM